MSAQVCIAPSPIEAVVDRIFASRRITRADQMLLMHCQAISLAEKTLIDRVFEGLKRGLLRVAD